MINALVMMNRRSQYIFGAALVVSLGMHAISFTWGVSSNKIAFIRSADLIYKYHGMIEAQNAYRQKMEGMNANMDTLQKDFQLAVSNYNTTAAGLSQQEREVQKELLGTQRNNLLQFKNAMDARAKEEDEKITQAVLNQVNGFVEEYGKKQGYDIILGTTLSGNLLYGREAIDITEEVLQALNENYSGKNLR